LEARRAQVAANWGVHIGRTHGHHIVHKVGASELSPLGKLHNSLSQQILEEFDIPVGYTKKDVRDAIRNNVPVRNLIIAPYEYVHSNPYVAAVHSRLTVAKNSSSNREVQISNINEALDDIRRIIENGGRL